MTNSWVKYAIGEIEADFQRSADTHLIRLNLPAFPGICLYLKDESTHPTGSLKHRLARSLFLYGLCNGWITENTTIIEASSGSTAVSEAYFARLIGLPFIAVMPSCTARRKVEQIAFTAAAVTSSITPPRSRRLRTAGERAERPLYGSVHLRRTRHRLARQQQHCRQHFPPDGARTFPGAETS